MAVRRKLTQPPFEPTPTSVYAPPVSLAYPPERSKSLVEKAFPLLFVVMLVMAFALGSLWTKVQYLSNPPQTTTTAGTGTTTQPAAQPQVSLDLVKGLFSKNLMKFGDANKKLLFVEIADPSCPYCHIAGGYNSDLNSQSTQFKLVKDGGSYVAPVQEMKKLVDEGKASYAYIYYPGHGNGEMATKALYCAYDQGKFWDVHAVLMSAAGYDKINNVIKNDKTKANELVDFIGNAANKQQLLACITSGKYDSRLSEEQQLAVTLGVQGTPGFFVNATNYPGAYSWNDMKAVAEAALQ